MIILNGLVCCVFRLPELVFNIVDQIHNQKEMDVLAYISFRIEHDLLSRNKSSFFYFWYICRESLKNVCETLYVWTLILPFCFNYLLNTAFRHEFQKTLQSITAKFRSVKRK